MSGHVYDVHVYMLRIKVIDCASCNYDFSIGLWNNSDNGVFIFHLILSVEQIKDEQNFKKTLYYRGFERNISEYMLRQNIIYSWIRAKCQWVHVDAKHYILVDSSEMAVSTCWCKTLYTRGFEWHVSEYMLMQNIIHSWVRAKCQWVHMHANTLYTCAVRVKFQWVHVYSKTLYTRGFYTGRDIPMAINLIFAACPLNTQL